MINGKIGVWYIIIIGSSIQGLLLIVLLCCLCKKKEDKPPPVRPSIYNAAYESVNIKRNNVIVDEVKGVL